MKISEFRKFLEKSRLGLPLAILIFFTSCAQVDNLSPGLDGNFTETVGDVTISDVDVFQGVIFLDGVVADRLDNFKDFNVANILSDEAQIQKVRDIHQQVIQELQNADAAYLSNFRSEITSGQYYRVQTALERTSNDVMQVMAKLSNQSVESLMTKSNAFLTTLSEDHEVDAAIGQDELVVMAEKQIKEVEPDNNVWLWVVAVVAAVAVLVVFWLAIVNDPGGDSFLMEEYLSTVTLELNGLQPDLNID